MNAIINGDNKKKKSLKIELIISTMILLISKRLIQTC